MFRHFGSKQWSSDKDSFPNNNSVEMATTTTTLKSSVLSMIKEREIGCFLERGRGVCSVLPRKWKRVKKDIQISCGGTGGSTGYFDVSGSGGSTGHSGGGGDHSKVEEESIKLGSRPYCCSFAPSDGSFYYYASQDHIVTFRQYLSNRPLFKFKATVGQWTITSYDLSMNSQYLAYTSLVPYIHLATLPYESLTAPTSSNHPSFIKQRVLDLTSQQEPDGFGLFCVKFSNDGQQLVAGSNTESLYLYDIASTTLLHRIQGHQDDVNSVCFLDSNSPNLLASASDDCLIKIWDKRSLGGNGGAAAGTLVGHTEGITHIDSKGDGRHLISNGKDQACKLWDIRKCMTTTTTQDLKLNRLDFDYRWQEYPARKPRVHPLDSSLQTYTGHSVLRTLIRCFFSPGFSTGARYVYSGSADGVVRIWDTLVAGGGGGAGNQDACVGVLGRGGGLIRDVSWHPFDMAIVAGVWSGEGGGGYSFRNQGGEIAFWEGGVGGGGGVKSGDAGDLEELWTDEEEQEEDCDDEDENGDVQDEDELNDDDEEEESNDGE